jgi:hypothetical protein
MPATLAARVSRSRRLRSVERPDGSPIIPVAPPTTAIGRCPASWRRRWITIGIRWPMCRLVAVGSWPA